MTRELDPLDVLIDLLGSGDFPGEVLDPEAAARIIIQRLDDAGFQIRYAPLNSTPFEIMSCESAGQGPLESALGQTACAQPRPRRS
jgi:hypothetical protein